MLLDQGEKDPEFADSGAFFLTFFFFFAAYDVLRSCSTAFGGHISPFSALVRQSGVCVRHFLQGFSLCRQGIRRSGFFGKIHESMKSE